MQVFVATFIDATVSSTGCACAKQPPSRMAPLQSPMFFAERQAQLFFLHAASSRPTPRPQATVHQCDMGTPGHLAIESLARLNQSFKASMPVDGGCLAQPHPVQFASNCLFTTVPPRTLRPRYAADVPSWHSAGHLTCRLLLPRWTNVWSHQARRF